LNNPYNAPNAELAEVGGEGTYDPKMFAVNGRIGRLRYIAYTWGASILLYIALGILAAIAIPVLMHGDDGPGGALIALFMIVVYVPAFAIGFIYAKRRLNDLDQTGWMSLLLIIPLVNFVFALYLVFAPGTDGPNRFGPAPSKNSGVIVWLIIIAFVLFGLIGVLAAIAIPAYQDYTKRAHAAQIQQPQQTQQDSQ